MWHDPNLAGARLSGNIQEKQGCDALVATAVLNAFSAGTRGRARSALRLHRPLGHPSSVAMSQEKPSGNVLENFLTDEDGSQLQSLQHYLSLPDQLLEYDYENRVVEDLGQNRVTEVKKGKEFNDLCISEAVFLE